MEWDKSKAIQKTALKRIYYSQINTRLEKDINEGEKRRENVDFRFCLLSNQQPPLPWPWWAGGAK